MNVRRRIAKWSLLVVLSGASWPLAGYAFANAEIGQKIDAPTLPTIDGGRHELVARKALANVFVFFRPEQDHSLDTLRQMADCEKEFAGKPVHFVAVVSDSWPKDQVKGFVKESGVKMPVLVDEGDKLYGALGVRLHPTIGIADQDAKIVAYEPFKKINYCDTVRARIRFQLKEIGEAELAKVLNPEKALMPGDVKGAVANRHVKMGQMFARSKNWEKAEEQAREAIAKEADFAPAHALLGDALSGKGDCAAAAKEYERALTLDPANAAAAAGKKACAGK